MRLLALAMLLCLPTSMQAGRRLRAIKNWVDSADVKGYDTTYARLPKQGFILYGNSYLTGSHLSLEYNSTSGNMQGNFAGHFDTRLATLFSVGIAYRGWGLSYSKDISKYGDSEWNFSTYGSAYGAEFRIHNSNSMSGTWDNGSQKETGIDVGHQRIMLANIYYVGNHKRFSLPAAMSHTIIQRRSCGSWLALLSYYRTRTLADKEGLGTVLGYTKQRGDQTEKHILHDLVDSKINVGGGYAYNYVFGHEHYLIHSSLMPSVSLWQSTKENDEVELYNPDGELDRSYQVGDDLSQELVFNASFHLGFVYNQGRFLSGVSSYVNYNNLRTKSSELKLYAFDWYSRIFIGFRF